MSTGLADGDNSLDSLVDGEVVNEIVVPDEQKKWAKIALDRMLMIR